MCTLTTCISSLVLPNNMTERAGAFFRGWRELTAVAFALAGTKIAMSDSLLHTRVFNAREFSIHAARRTDATNELDSRFPGHQRRRGKTTN